MTRSSRARSRSPSTSAPICASACDRNFRAYSRCGGDAIMHRVSSTPARAVWGVAAALALTAPPASAAGVEDFYRGKNLSLLIGYSVGGGYDAYARLLARHLGRHVPGNPVIVA